VLCLITVPAIITCLFFPTELICLFAGSEYLDAVPVLRIYSFIMLGVLVITLAGTRIYVARKKEKKLFCILLGGATINIIVNSCLIGLMGILGAALATLTAYIVVMVVELTLEHTWKYIFTKDKLNYLYGAGLISGIFLVCKFVLHSHPALTLLFSILFAGLFYVLLMLYLQEYTVSLILGKIKIPKKIN
jgi:O-antigen/teichoic acid export membrane protein